MDPDGFDRRRFLAGAVAGGIIAWPERARPASADKIKPEDFGARGDGRTNDTAAFHALSNQVNKRGGGTIELGQGKTYVVGRQVRDGNRYFLSPLPIMRFERLRFPLRISGNGARLLAAPGLKFGVFDEETLRPLQSAMPNFGPNGIAAPYDAMIWISDCFAPIQIRHVELDGNCEQMIVGGGYGDTGHQLPGSGIILTNNRSDEKIESVYTHHHPLDGMIIDGAEERNGNGDIHGLVADDNGRQGVSIVGGTSYSFFNCDFSQTGRAGIFSKPGAGVDIEAEGKRIRNIAFRNCSFSANSGPGLLADQGDSAAITCTDCTFIGTTSWSAWPNKPRMRFKSCRFVGALARPFASADPELATQFDRCIFKDDPGLAPGGKVFFSNKTGAGPIVDMGGNAGTNILFNRCIFQLTHKGRLPWSWKAIYIDNLMSQASKEVGYPRGQYRGRNVIRGRVDLYSSSISGELVVNGQRVTR